MLKNSLNNYVVSSRVRLARNIKDFVFPDRLEYADGSSVVDIVSKPLLNKEGYTLYKLNMLSDLELKQLIESHLISPKLIQNRDLSAVVLDSSREVSVMINEEDHIRLQVIMRGFELDDAFNKAMQLDDIINAEANIAYHDKLGYITGCPTNLGTGMRASVMMFLPALILSNTINQAISNASIAKMALRGIYGEGSKAEGFMFQLSNQHTLGISEKEIIASVKQCADVIAAAEENARAVLYERNKILLTDRILRAWGLLTNSYTMTSQEFLEHISYVKMGVGLGIIRLKSPELIDSLITDCQPANLSRLLAPDAGDIERDVKRAEFLKDRMEKLGRY